MRSRLFSTVLSILWLATVGLVQADLVVDLDASVSSSVTVNGSGEVSTWTDQSGNGNDAAAVDGTVHYPSVYTSASGLAGVDFSGGNNQMDIMTSGESDAFLDFNGSAEGGLSVLIVFRDEGSASDPASWADLIGNISTTGDGFFIRYDDSKGSLKFQLDSTVTIGTVADGDTVVVGLNYDASSGAYTCVYETSSGLSDTVTGTITAGDFSTGNALSIGATVNSNRYFEGMIGEIKIYDAKRDDGDFTTEFQALVDDWVEIYDIDPPTPNPATWASPPRAISAFTVDMTATTASDISGVEYLFTETSGNNGGTSSGWQGSPYYRDGGLEPLTEYSYTVTLRDTAGPANISAPSNELSVTTPDAGPGRSEGPPNIVFIFADDLGYGDLSCYGHPDMRTPTLDKLATEGTRFESFHVTGVTCCPSRTGFMTSRHPASYPAYMSDHGFADRVTVTELLHQRGYKVGHFGKWHIGPIEKNGTYGIDHIDVIGGSNDSHDGRDANLFGAAMDFIEDNKDVPFYVNVWGHISHFQVNPHESLVEDFSDFTLNRSDYGSWQQGKFDLSQAIIDYFSLPENLTMGMRNYMGDVYSLDIQVGYLLDKLDELGLRDNTIIVFSSDQGAAPVITVDKVISGNKEPDSCKNMLGYAGQFSGGKHTQLEGGVRSPFIIRWPGHVPEGVVNSTSTISALDWLPTLCSIAGIDIDGNSLQIEGEDVSDIFYGATRSQDRALFWKTSSTGSSPAMLEGKWKMHRKNSDIELYDLESDPGENINLAAVRSDVVNAMTPKLDAWVATLPGAYDKDKVESPLSPVANAGGDQQVFDLDGNGTEPVTLDASASSDPDGYISGCIWREYGQIIALTDGPTVNLPLGTHTLEVEVTDYAGNTDFDSVTITVSTSPGLGIDTLRQFCLYWLDDCSGPNWCQSMDTNHDKEVNLQDLAHLANLWMP